MMLGIKYLLYCYTRLSLRFGSKINNHEISNTNGRGEMALDHRSFKPVSIKRAL
jgi:hypothetical protein